MGAWLVAGLRTDMLLKQVQPPLPGSRCSNFDSLDKGPTYTATAFSLRSEQKIRTSVDGIQTLQAACRRFAPLDRSASAMNAQFGHLAPLSHTSSASRLLDVSPAARSENGC